jgi:hypothetical protein
VAKGPVSYDGQAAHWDSDFLGLADRKLHGLRPMLVEVALQIPFQELLLKLLKALV